MWDPTPDGDIMPLKQHDILKVSHAIIRVIYVVTYLAGADMMTYFC